jgi:hypothetical protein
MDTGHMISWRRYGYRMIGGAHARALRMGMGAPALTFTSANYRAPGTTSFQGESTTVVAPPPPAPKKSLALHLGPVVAATAPAPVKAIPLHLAPTVTAIALTPDAVPVSTTDAFIPPVVTVDAATPPADCPSCTGKVVAAGLGGGLLMYLVGLATREMKKKKRGR